MKRKVLAASILLVLAAGLPPASAVTGDMSVACLNIINGTTPQGMTPSQHHLWSGPATGLTFEVTFEGPTCPDATYTQFVLLDSDQHGDLPGHSDDDGIAKATAIGNNTNTLTFQIATPDNDGTICTWTLASGTTESDANDNGNTIDDQHKTNDGNNSDGTKHDWPPATDRAPDDEGVCLPLYTIPPPPGGGAGGQNYN